MSDCSPFGRKIFDEDLALPDELFFQTDDGMSLWKAGRDDGLERLAEHIENIRGGGCGRNAAEYSR